MDSPRYRKQKWRNDPRSSKFSHHKYFGTAAPQVIPETLGRPDGYLHNQIQTLRCTGYGCAANGECIHGVVMAPDWAAMKIGKKQGQSVDINGGDPNATMKHMRDDGFLPLSKSPFTLQKDGVEGSGMNAPWPASLDAEAANYDLSPAFVKVDGPYGVDIFDRIKSAIFLAYDPQTKLGAAVDVFGRWFYEWNGAGIIPNQYALLAGYHHYIFFDFCKINGIEYLKAKNSYGSAAGLRGFFYFPREVVNREFALSGTSLKILKIMKKEWIEEAKKQTPIGRIWYGIMQAWWLFSERFGGYTNEDEAGLIAGLRRLIAGLQAYLANRKEQPQPEPQPKPDPKPLPEIMPDRIKQWAKLIQGQEGGRPSDLNMRLNNPGNLKYTAYTASLAPGCKKDVKGSDGGYFCHWDTYEHGFQALCKFLHDAANNELKYYKNCTLDQFTEIYAHPPNKNYATAVAAGLGVSIHISIKDLLGA